jgi:hypothetical protein
MAREFGSRGFFLETERTMPHDVKSNPIDQRLGEQRLVPEAGLRHRELVERRLRESPYLCLRAIRCEHQQGVLTLRGMVPSYYHKQLAQALVAQFVRGGAFVNQIEVA